MSDEMVEKARAAAFEKWFDKNYYTIDGLARCTARAAYLEGARSAVRDAVRECIATCEAVAVNLAQFHSAMPAGARECASALRKKFKVEG